MAAVTREDQTTDAHIENLVAQLLREDLLAAARSRAEGWRRFAWLLALLLGCAVVGNVWQGTQHHWVIRYVEVDKASQTQRVIEPAAERYEPSEAIVHGVLSDAIVALRAIGTDREHVEETWEKVRLCTTGRGYELLKQEEARLDSPKKQKLPRRVVIVRILKKTPRSYDLRWMEYQYNDKMTLMSTQTYGGIVTFERRDPKTEAELQTCRAGIFLDTWNWGKDQ